MPRFGIRTRHTSVSMGCLGWMILGPVVAAIAAWIAMWYVLGVLAALVAVVAVAARRRVR